MNIIPMMKQRLDVCHATLLSNHQTSHIHTKHQATNPQAYLQSILGTSSHIYYIQTYKLINMFSCCGQTWCVKLPLVVHYLCAHPNATTTTKEQIHTIKKTTRKCTNATPSIYAYTLNTPPHITNINSKYFIAPFQ